MHRLFCCICTYVRSYSLDSQRILVSSSTLQNWSRSLWKCTKMFSLSGNVFTESGLSGHTHISTSNILHIDNFGIAITQLMKRT